MLNFTPGPWTVNDAADAVWTTTNHHETICVISVGKMGMGPFSPDRPTGTFGSVADDAERKANCHILAAAPELFELARCLAERDGRDDPLVQEAAMLVERIQAVRE